MYRFTVQPVVIILILFPAAVQTADGNVEFWREDVTLTCPGQGQWFSEDTKLDNDDKDTYTFPYKSRITYHCKYASEKYYFYVEGKTCRNCFELDASLLLGVLAVNLTMTVVVMIIVYKCTKKSSVGFTKAPARSGAPPTPSRDYEVTNRIHQTIPTDKCPTPSQESGQNELRHHTRTQDPYSFVNRTG